MINLGVNIDHVATIKIRGEDHPNPHVAAKNAIKFKSIRLQYILEKMKTY